MTMIPCHEYGKMKCDSAGRYPHCGARHDYGGYAWALIITIILAGLLTMIFKCGN